MRRGHVGGSATGRTIRRRTSGTHTGRPWLPDLLRHVHQYVAHPLRNRWLADHRAFGNRRALLRVLASSNCHAFVVQPARGLLHGTRTVAPNRRIPNRVGGWAAGVGTVVSNAGSTTALCEKIGARLDDVLRNRIELARVQLHHVLILDVIRLVDELLECSIACRRVWVKR